MKKFGAMLLAVVMLFALCACGQKSDAAAWQEQYDLGVRYLTEGNYEQAVLAFEAAIEIDPKRADAYIGLAEVYAAQGDTEKAAAILDGAMAELGATAELTAAKAALAAPSPSPEPTLEPIAPPRESLELTEMELADVRVEYLTDSDLIALNEGAIGAVAVDFTVIAPAEVCRAEITLIPKDASIAEILEVGLEIQPYAKGYADRSWGLGMPVFDGFDESQESVLILGFNEDYELVGYSVVEIGTGVSLLRQGITENMIHGSEIHFLDHSMEWFDIETMEHILLENGFEISRNDDSDDYWRISGDRSRFGTISARQDKDEDYVSHWSYWASRDYFPIGMRDICINDSFEAVLTKLGFSNASDAAMWVSELEYEFDDLNNALHTQLEFNSENFNMHVTGVGAVETENGKTKLDNFSLRLYFWDLRDYRFYFDFDEPDEGFVLSNCYVTFDPD